MIGKTEGSPNWNLVAVTTMGRAVGTGETRTGGGEASESPTVVVIKMGGVTEIAVAVMTILPVTNVTGAASANMIGKTEGSPNRNLVAVTTMGRAVGTGETRTGVGEALESPTVVVIKMGGVTEITVAVMTILAVQINEDFRITRTLSIATMTVDAAIIGTTTRCLRRNAIKFVKPVSLLLPRIWNYRPNKRIRRHLHHYLPQLWSPLLLRCRGNIRILTG